MLKSEKEIILMDSATIFQMLGQMGAPLVFCVVLGWYVKYKDDKNREDTKELIKAHKEESEKFADALNKNTIVLERLVTIIGDDNE